MVRGFEHGRKKTVMRSKLIHYLIGMTIACVLLNVWFMAINAPSDFRAIYAALSAALSAVIVEGRKKKNDQEPKP